MIPVRLDQVSKTYANNTPAVSMDVTIEKGEFFTLLGPSGCGKSTMLRTIAGFVQPTTGRVYFGERDVTRTPPHRRDTGMVFQNYALFPHLTVAQNVAYGLTVRKVTKAARESRVERALDQVGLTGYGTRRIDQLSGGQQQRVALARAVVIEPAVLLLDEPLSNLDAKLREETRAQIREVQRNAGITAVYVTHDQSEAMAMSDRIAVLEGGKVHQVGTPREIYHQPETAFVAKFIGRSNVLPAELGAVGAERTTVVLPGGIKLAVRTPGNKPIHGTSVGVSLRPEALAFCDPADGLLRGTLTSEEFTGATSSYDVAVGDLTVTVTGDAQRGGPRQGDTVGLTTDPERAWLVSL
ncbi:ABC transporter ATP-binding protein [Amycolatopsis sp. EV170708-02-1]|uniref:ABC transporter ATP-binding protein n=1 Tax=Amycolatopsis sp. EV170708-02-1 TaxID=2919322 RepID=UPI001F0BB18D|nr:ABC transporter ATP-binding protein [Amycolatopsis sp. EV170708-02-1]UMP00113.1 ABC transporter ATP-binding protein [Amycolatopsis sp. EV170708-02-1]